MSAFKERIGSKSLLMVETVSLERVYEFCDAVGAPKSTVAPPTFMTTLRRGEFELFSHLGMKMSQILHTEQEFQYHGDIRANQEIEFQTEFLQAMERSSPEMTMHFLTFATQVWDHASLNLIGVSRTKVIVRVAK